MIFATAAEYNPFHNGHAYHISQIKKLGADGIIAVMSGSFVQRGEPAVMSKFERAKCAVRNGVDLVLESSSRWHLSHRRAHHGVSRKLHGLSPHKSGHQ